MTVEASPGGEIVEGEVGSGLRGGERADKSQRDGCIELGEDRNGGRIVAEKDSAEAIGEADGIAGEVEEKIDFGTHHASEGGVGLPGEEGVAVGT